MIDLAQRAHGDKGAVFEATNFAEERASGRKYDSIIFNAALQFFEDQEATIASAAAMLSDSDDARIVVSHVSGAAFVRKEFGDSGATVRNTMPLLSMMQRIASENGLQVVLPSFFGTEVEAIESSLEDFYLLVFVRDRDGEQVGALGSAAALDLPDEMSGLDLTK